MTKITIGGTGVLVGLNDGRTKVGVWVTGITVGIGIFTSGSEHPVTVARATTELTIRIKQVARIFDKYLYIAVGFYIYCELRIRRSAKIDSRNCRP